MAHFRGHTANVGSNQNVLPGGRTPGGGRPLNQRERAAQKRERAINDAKRKEAIARYMGSIGESLATEGQEEFKDEREFERGRKRREDPDFFLGRNPHSPKELFFREDDDRPERGALGEFYRDLFGYARGIVEAGSEAADIIGGVGPSDTRDILDKPIVNKFGFGELDEATATELKKEGTPEQSQRSSNTAIQKEAFALTEGIKANEALIEQLEPGESDDPVIRFQAGEVREQKELEIAEMEIQLLELSDRLSTQDAIFGISAEKLGLTDELDLTGLEAALAAEGGLGSVTHKAILEIANNAALNEEQRDAAIDIVMTRQNFTEEITLAINDMVENKATLEAFILRPDIEILDDVEEFLNPTFNFNVTGETDTERFHTDLKNSVDLIIEVPDTVPDGDLSLDIYDELILEVMQFGADTDTAGLKIARIATAWKLDERDIHDAFVSGRKTAVDNKEMWDIAANADSLIPGSKPMIAAIYQAGEEIGFDPALLEMASMSKALHALIEEKSGGISGRRGTGTIAGVGGLTLEMYKTVMNGEEWNPTQGMAWELKALLEYIRQVHQSNALSAVTFWRDSGQWGGTETFMTGDELAAANG